MKGDEKENVAGDPDNARLLESLQAELASWREQQGDNVTMYAEGNSPVMEAPLSAARCVKDSQ